MITTDDAELAALLRHRRNLCFSDDMADRFKHDGVGFNYRMSSLQAALGYSQLRRFDIALAAKRRIARRYEVLFENVEGVVLPPHSSWCDHTYWVYGLVLDPKDGWPSQKHVLDHLKKSGIDARPFFQTLQSQTWAPREIRDLPAPYAQWLSSHGIYVPSFVEITEEEQVRVVEAIVSARQVALKT
jgi:perosamine synthetase